jgi:hypothetical protein
MIRVELPEPAIQHVEMLIRKELSDLVDIVLICDLVQNLEQSTVLEVSERDLAVVIYIKHEENPHNHGFRVTVLKLRCCLQEL